MKGMLPNSIRLSKQAVKFARKLAKSNNKASRNEERKQTASHLSQPQKCLPYFILNTAPAAPAGPATHRRGEQKRMKVEVEVELEWK